MQRNSITHILVCKPKRPTPSLTEFLEIEESDLNIHYGVDGQRPFVSGHNRYIKIPIICQEFGFFFPMQKLKTKVSCHKFTDEHELSDFAPKIFMIQFHEKNCEQNLHPREF